MTENTDIKNIYDEIIKSQNLEKEMYKELETYKTSKEKTIEIVRQINAYVIQRRKLISKFRTACYEECGECEKKAKNDEPTKYTKLKHRAFVGHNIKVLHRKSKQECEEECNKDIDCKGYSYRNDFNKIRKCALKNKIGRMRRVKNYTLFIKEEDEVIEDEVIEDEVIEDEFIELCSEFEKTMDEEENLNEMKVELKQRLNLTLPLESNTLKAVFLNTYSDKYYSSLANILRTSFLFFLLLNIVLIIEINIQQIPVLIFNIIKIIIIGFFGINIYISYQDHFTRDNTNFDKYNFANDRAQYSDGTVKYDNTNVDNTNVDNTNVDGSNINECVLDLCKNGNCCPDQMFFDNVKGKCVVGNLPE
jgi:hypothetical protein